MDFARAALGYVPEDAGRVYDIHNSQAPGLRGGWARGRDVEFAREIEGFDVGPPCVEVVDH